MAQEKRTDMKGFTKSSWGEVDKEHLDPKLIQRVFSTQNVLVVHYVYEPGLEFETHSHPQEQVTLVQTGKLLFTIGGEKVELGKGDICAISPNVAHSIVVVGEEKVESISIFSPMTENVIIHK